MARETNKKARLAEMILRATALRTPVPNLIAHWERMIRERDPSKLPPSRGNKR